jgi:hydroxymethylpyrimidine pyrophosphatase-like HAD family hydrolase
LADVFSRGVEVALVTGRSFHFTRPIAELLPIPLTLILNNGAVVKDRNGVTSLRHLLPRDAARLILAETRAYEDSVAIVFDRPDERQVIFDRMDWSHPQRRGYYEKNRAFIAAAPVFARRGADRRSDPGDVQRRRQCNAESRIRAARIGRRGSVHGRDHGVRSARLRAVDVNGAACSKGTTLARWAAARGIARDQDHGGRRQPNDVEMLDFAGVAVVMGNAADGLKSRGYRLTGSNDEAGLASAISAYVSNGQ